MKHPILSTQNHLRIRLTRSHTSTRRRRSTRRLIVPGKVGVVAQFSRFDEMRRSEQGTEKNAKSTNNNVRDTQERVLATHDGAC